MQGFTERCILRVTMKELLASFLKEGSAKFEVAFCDIFILKLLDEVRDIRQWGIEIVNLAKAGSMPRFTRAS